MTDVERLQAAVFDELKEVRRRGVVRLDDPKIKIDTRHLEAAAREIPEYDDRMTRAAAVFLLLEHEVPRVSQPHREWLEYMFALPEELRGRNPGTLRNEAAKLINEDPANFGRTGGKADQAITSLAAQIVADCFKESPGPDPIEKNARRLNWWYVATGVIVIAALVVGLVLFLTKNQEQPQNRNQPNATQLEARYDGKDPRGLSGTDTKCADPPPSQAVPSSTPPVYGPDGQQVGTVELRTSPICPVIWARVLWNSDPNATYQIPPGWTLHVIAHRPETNTVFDFPEPSGPGPIPYGLGPMLTTLRGCVYVEAYFMNDATQQKTHTVPTSCVTAGAPTG
jgi:hypothetical protein